MTEHLPKGTDPKAKTITQLQHELTQARRRYLTIYALCEDSIKATDKLHHRCIQTETKLRAMIVLFLVSAMLNGLLLGICIHAIQQAPAKSPTIYIPEQMMPDIHHIA